MNYLDGNGSVKMSHVPNLQICLHSTSVKPAKKIPNNTQYNIVK